MLKFTAEHEWLKLEGDVATVGITTHAAEQLGDLVFVELPEVGATFDKGADAATVLPDSALGLVELAFGLQDRPPVNGATPPPSALPDAVLDALFDGWSPEQVAEVIAELSPAADKALAASSRTSRRLIRSPRRRGRGERAGRRRRSPARPED